MLTLQESEIIHGLHGSLKERSLSEQKLFSMYKEEFSRQGMYKYHLPEDEAAEAYSETIRAVLHNIHLGRFQETTDHSLRAYIATVYRNKSIDIIRKKINRHEQLNDTLANQLPASLRDVIIERISEKDLRRKINACYANLGETCRNLMMLLEEGLKDKEIAAKLELNSPDVAKQTKFNCRKKLKDCLKLTGHE
jgi:RNA polymerase sigma factor (sigma-70 family)